MLRALLAAGASPRGEVPRGTRCAAPHWRGAATACAAPVEALLAEWRGAEDLAALAAAGSALDGLCDGQCGGHPFLGACSGLAGALRLSVELAMDHVEPPAGAVLVLQPAALRTLLAAGAGAAVVRPAAIAPLRAAEAAVFSCAMWRIDAALAALLDAGAPADFNLKIAGVRDAQPLHILSVAVEEAVNEALSLDERSGEPAIVPISREADIAARARKAAHASAGSAHRNLSALLARLPRGGTAVRST